MAIAWALAKGPRIVPLVGSRTRAQLDEALGALAIRLTADQVATLEAPVPAAAAEGTRYAPMHIPNLESERV